MLGACLLLAGSLSASEAPQPLPPFEQIYKVLQEHLGTVSENELDQALVRGLLDELGSQVVLVDNATAAAEASVPALSRATVYDKAFAYYRVARVEPDVSKKISAQHQEFAGTNKIKGAVLDLRFAEGDDFAAAGAVADLFLSAEQPLLNWGVNSVKSTKKQSAIDVPVVVLVNKQTRGAAEALAAVLREAQVALLIGASTAGQASVFKEFTLQSGQRLRVAVAPVKVAGDKALSPEGVKPDIEVAVKAEEEKALFEDAYTVLPKPMAKKAEGSDTNAVASTSGTNQPRARINEAELVRRHREGLATEEEYVEKPKANETEPRLINDPALARALDLLKGLAVVQRNRPL